MRAQHSTRKGEGEARIVYAAGLTAAAETMAAGPMEPEGTEQSGVRLSFAEVGVGWQHEDDREVDGEGGGRNGMDIVAWGMLALARAGAEAVAAGGSEEWAVWRATRLPGPPGLEEGDAAPRMPPPSAREWHESRITGAWIYVEQLRALREDHVSHLPQLTTSLSSCHPPLSALSTLLTPARSCVAR